MDRKDLERPRTIDELMDFVREHNLPYEKMRFFIGEDYREPKAFGIFKNADGEFVVYKNKANGERAVRYQGPDEEYAVRELWERMLAEIENQRAHQNDIKASKGGTRAKDRPPLQERVQHAAMQGCGVLLLTAVISLVVSSCTVLTSIVAPDKGYYAYEDGYYCYTNTWYRYDESDQIWLPSSAPGPFWNRRKHFERRFTSSADEYADTRADLGYTGDGWVYDFTDTSYYVDWEREEAERRERADDDDSSWDDDDSSSWDWDDDDDWDSDYTDWDSDW